MRIWLRIWSCGKEGVERWPQKRQLSPMANKSVCVVTLLAWRSEVSGPGHRLQGPVQTPWVLFKASLEEPPELGLAPGNIRGHEWGKAAAEAVQPLPSEWQESNSRLCFLSFDLSGCSVLKALQAWKRSKADGPELRVQCEILFVRALGKLASAEDYPTGDSSVAGKDRKSPVHSAR